MDNNKIRITITGILQDLSNGFTRTTSSHTYNPEIGSIKEKYGLNKSEVKDLFDHPKLKNKKTISIKESKYILIDDTIENELSTLSGAIEVPIIDDNSENGHDSLENVDANDTNTLEEENLMEHHIVQEEEESFFNVQSSPLDLD